MDKYVIGEDFFFAFAALEDHMRDGFIKFFWELLFFYHFLAELEYTLLEFAICFDNHATRWLDG